MKGEPFDGLTRFEGGEGFGCRVPFNRGIGFEGGGGRGFGCWVPFKGGMGFEKGGGGFED